MNKKMKKCLISVLSILLLCTMFAVTGSAQVPLKINYQGYLEDNSTGLPVTGTKTMEFAIYDAPTGGNQIWSEPAKTVQVDQGKFSVHLGETNPITLSKAQAYYLEVKVDSQILKDPMGNDREELTSSMYALFVDGVALDNDDNTSVGIGAGENTTSFPFPGWLGRNTFIGRDSGHQNTTGRMNTFIGVEAGYNSDGIFSAANTFIGYQAGYNSGTAENTIYGSVKNTFIGYQAGYENAGDSNVFIGDNAGDNNTTGSRNVFIGSEAGDNNTTGNSNVFIGSGAGRNHSTEGSNVFIGSGAGSSHIAGYDNIFIGPGTGEFNETGSRNIFIGRNAGSSELGSDKLYIGNYVHTTLENDPYGGMPLIYGEFDNRLVRINGAGDDILQIRDLQYNNSLRIGTDNDLRDFIRIRPSGGDGVAITNNGDTIGLFVRASNGNVGVGTTNPSEKLTVRGNLLIQRRSDGTNVVELGEGLDYAEGFDVANSTTLDPGTVLVIDPENPGKLTISNSPYDTKVAGIVAGAKGMGSGVRLGADQFDYDVALAGRVYCNVDATYSEVLPGDLLTTSPTPGYAMVVDDYAKAQGAILGKAMESLKQGKKGQILVLVTLQ